MSFSTIIHLVVALAGFASAWTIQDWRHGAEKADYAQQQLQSVRQNAAADLRRADNAIAAQNARTAREGALRADADGLRGALVGLHGAAAGAIAEAQQSAAACTERAATLAELFEQSAGRYGELAQKADRHASDVKTLVDAWPRE